MNHKVSWRRSVLYIGIIVVMLALSCGLHEVGHYLASKFIYGVGGYFGANGGQLFFQPDAPVGWGVGYAGGIFSALVFMVVFMLVKSEIIKAFCFLVVAIHFINGIVEGAFFNFYFTNYGLLVIGSISVVVYLLYLVFNVGNIVKELTN